jgi:hypothetical protein
MQLYHRLVALLRRWWSYDRRAPRSTSIPLIVPMPPTIHREVTSAGVHVYCLCSSCGARLHASATLCEECARARSRSTPPL